MTIAPTGFETDSFADFEGTGPSAASGPASPGAAGPASGRAGTGASPPAEVRLVRAAAPALRALAPVAARALAATVPAATGLTLDDGLAEAEDWLEAAIAESEAWEAEADEAETSGPGSEESTADSGHLLDALAEALLAEAARAPNDAEAAMLAGGITIVILGPAPIEVRRLAPILCRGTTLLVRALRARPETRPMLPVVGTIARRTVRTLAGGAGAGRPLTPSVAARAMARHTRRVLGQPRVMARALHRNARMRRPLTRPRPRSRLGEG